MEIGRLSFLRQVSYLKFSSDLNNGQGIDSYKGMANSLQSQISRQDSSIFLTLEPCSIRRIPAAGSASMRRKTRKEARYVNFWTNSLNTLSKKYEVWRMKYNGRIQAAGSASMSRKAWKEVRCVDFWTNSFQHSEYEVWSMKIEVQWKNTSCRICLYEQEDLEGGGGARVVSARGGMS